jgi:hypothetical protein
MTKNENDGLLGYNNPANIFGRDKDAQEPAGERVLEPKDIIREEYDSNLGPIPLERVNLD